MNAEPRFAASVANALGYGFSLLIVVMFLRNLVDFPVFYAPLILGGVFAVLAFLRRKAGFPKPTKGDIMPFIPVLFIVVFELAYFQSYPIFPEFQSADFAQHLALTSDYAKGGLPRLTSQILYYGIEYVLSLGLLSGGLPLSTVRFEMGIFVALSPLWFYLAAFKLFRNHRTAWMVALTYGLGGSWYAMVFVSGLYANFYGWFASLFLITASIDFLAKKAGVFSVVLLSLALVNALLSHYTVLVMLFLLAVYGLARSKRDQLFRRGLLLCLMLLAPVAIGAVAFGGLVGTLFGFLSGGANFLGGTWLSSRIPIPSLGYLVAEINNDWLVTILIIPALLAFILLTTRKASPEKLLVLAWFIIPLMAVPFEPISWRFSFVAYPPLIFMVGYVLSNKVKDMPRDWFRRSLWAPALLIVFLFLTTSTPLMAFNDNEAGVQANDYKAMTWMVAHSNGTTTALVLTDWHFIYSQSLDGPPIAYAPNANVIWYDPNNAYFSAINHTATWLVWTKSVEGVAGYGVFIPECQKPFEVVLTANTTQTRVDRVVSFDMVSRPKLDLRGYLVVGNNTIPIGLNNGTGKVELAFKKTGDYAIFTQFRNVVTDSFVLRVRDNGTAIPAKASVSIPDDYCLPWKSFNNLSLPGGHLVYQNENVKIWRIRSGPESQITAKLFHPPVWHLGNMGLRKGTLTFQIYDSNNRVKIPPPNIRTTILELRPQIVISSSGLGSLTSSDCQNPYPCFSGAANFMQSCDIGQTYAVKMEVSYLSSFANSTTLSGNVVCLA